MPESLGNEQSLSRFGIQFDCVPLAERGRTHADIYHQVKDSAVETLNVLSLPGGHIGEVHAANGPQSRYGNVHLLQIEASPGGLNEDRLLERFQEDSAVIASKDRSESPHAID